MNETEELLKRILECELRSEIRSIEHLKQWTGLLNQFKPLLPRLAAIFPEIPQLPPDELEIPNA